jgi:hypothetical protein
LRAQPHKRLLKLRAVLGPRGADTRVCRAENRLGACAS